MLVVATSSVCAQQSSEPTTLQVDLGYLANHPEEFKDRTLTANGTVGFYASIFMFEDFWLQKDDQKIPAVTRFASLPTHQTGHR